MLETHSDVKLCVNNLTNGKPSLSALSMVISWSVTWYRGSWVRRVSSLNSSWMLVTSATVLSEVQRGGWAVPLPMFTSEYGILDGVLKAGISREPMSFCREGLQITCRHLWMKGTKTQILKYQGCWKAWKTQNSAYMNRGKVSLQE